MRSRQMVASHIVILLGISPWGRILCYPCALAAIAWLAVMATIL